VLHCDGERTGLFSMLVLPWPTPLPVACDEMAHDDWQTLIPPDSPDPAADAELMKIIYQTHARPTNIVQSMAEYSEDDWQYVLHRWAAIRAYHRQYILDHPGCIALDMSITDPDPEMEAHKRAVRQRLDRQQWLSRLLVATPRILAAAEYARIRRQIEPADGMQRVEQKGRGKYARGEQPAIVVQRSQGDLLVAAPAQPAPDVVMPIGFVSGATPQPGTIVPVPQVGDDRTLAEVMQQRGTRRARADISAGFDDLLATNDEVESDA
jgi:hypothetical protein